MSWPSQTTARTPAAAPEPSAGLDQAPYLSVCIGKDLGQRFEIKEGRSTLGRSETADIVIHDDEISRVHCAVIRAGDEVALEDCRSKNGTFVNGRRIEREVLASGAVIQIGQTVLRMEHKYEEEVAFEETLLRLATTDPTTGVANRHYFMLRAREEIPFLRRTECPVGLVMVDLDYFKNTNDAFGHPGGDYVLSQVANLLRSNKREEDLLGRYGGDEFVLLLRGQLTIQGATDFCERIRQAVDAFGFRYADKDVSLTVSLGLFFFDGRHYPDLNEMIAQADRALYRAKQSGRNRVELAK